MRFYSKSKIFFSPIYGQLESVFTDEIENYFYARLKFYHNWNLDTDSWSLFVQSRLKIIFCVVRIYILHGMIDKCE